MFKMRLKSKTAQEPAEVSLERADRTQSESHLARVNDRTWEVEVETMSGGAGWLRIHGRIVPFQAARVNDGVLIWTAGRAYELEKVDATPQRATSAAAASTGEIKAPMPGKVLKIDVAPGDAFTAHQPLIVMESMKMEMTLSAPAPGRVKDILCKPGDLVEMGAVLARLDEEDAGDS